VGYRVIRPVCHRRVRICRGGRDCERMMADTVTLILIGIMFAFVFVK
jgi:hypothetical protein